MATELVLLGTAGAPMPVVGRGGISSALVVDGRIFVVDCAEWARRAGQGFSGTTTAGRDGLPRAVRRGPAR
jgi:hypothetical protein